MSLLQADVSLGNAYAHKYVEGLTRLLHGPFGLAAADKCVVVYIVRRQADIARLATVSPIWRTGVVQLSSWRTSFLKCISR